MDEGTAVSSVVGQVVATDLDYAEAGLSMHNIEIIQKACLFFHSTLTTFIHMY